MQVDEQRTLGHNLLIVTIVAPQSALVNMGRDDLAGDQTVRAEVVDDSIQLTLQEQK